MQHNEHDLVTLARTLWGEARGEPLEGQIAVAWVIRNRAERARFAGRLVGADGAVAYVCLAPWQFSCWNEGDPNRAKLLVLRQDQCAAQIEVGRDVLEARVADPTGGADHYHTIDAPRWAHEWPPSWVPTMAESARFGGHVFYDSRRAA